MSKPFLIRHRDGREYELENSKAGIAFYREHYQTRGFAIVRDPGPDHEVPDLSDPKPKAAKDEKPVEKKADDA